MLLLEIHRQILFSAVKTLPGRNRSAFDLMAALPTPSQFLRAMRRTTESDNRHLDAAVTRLNFPILWIAPRAPEFLDRFGGSEKVMRGIGIQNYS